MSRRGTRRAGQQCPVTSGDGTSTGAHTATPSSIPPNREDRANAVSHQCRRCGHAVVWVSGTWITVDDGSTAAGLAYCPPDPTGIPVGPHLAVERDPR